jgi:FXSXX-COOH protein
MEVPRMRHDDLVVESSLVDISEVDLELLPALADSVLAQSIQRVLRAAEDPDEMTLSFQQSI